MCDKKNSVLFVKTECLVLSPDFKLPDENQVLLKVPRQNNMYNFDLKNVVLSGGLTCLFVKSTIDESNLWHRRLGHINFKTMNKRVRENLVKGLPSKIFENDHTCVACQKGKHPKASFSIACYVQNRVLVTKPHNKTPYELLIGRSPNIEFMKPFGCPVTILNTLDHLGKFKRKADEGFLVGYSVNSIEINANAGKAGQEKASDHEYILLPFMPSSTQISDDKDAGDVPDKGDKGVSKGSGTDDQEKTDNNTQDIGTAKPSINTTSTNINIGNLNINIVGSNDLSMPSLEETGIFDDVYDDREVAAETDTKKLELSTVVSHIPTTREHKDHPKEQIIGDLNLATQTRRMLNFSKENAMEPKKTLVDLPNGKRAIRTKWVFRNKKDERGIVIRNTTSLVAQGYTQEKGIDYDELFAPVARIEAIRIFLAYASFMRFIVYQIDVKSAFVYGTIEDEVRGTIDKSLFIKKDRDDILLVQVYVDDIIFGSTKNSLCNDFEQMMHKRFQMSSMRELTFFLGLQVKQKDDGIFISQDKSMIRSLMYLTTSRPDIMFVVCGCARFQVTPKTSHLHAVKRIFRYLKGQPKLGLWYPRDSPFDLEAFSNSDYAGASLNRKSTIGAYVVLLVAVDRCYGFKIKCLIIVFHSKTKHIEIRHHFIRDSYEKKLIQVIKIHTDHTVADLLTKDFNFEDELSEEFGVAYDEIQGVDVFFRLSRLLFKSFKTLCLFKYALMKRHDYDITSSLRRGALHKMKVNAAKHQLTTDVMVFAVGIVNFLNSNPIKYALTMSPTIYTSCIKQFWMSAKVKTVNDDVRIQSLADRKKVIVNEASIRRDLRLNDVERTACLPTATIFEELARMRVFSLEQTKTNQAAEIETLKKRVKKLEGKKKKRTYGLKRLYKISLSARTVSSNKEGLGEDKDQDLSGVHDLDGDEVFVDVTTGENVEQDATVTEKVVTTIEYIEVTTADATTPQISQDELILAQALMEIKAAKPKANGLTIQEPSKFRTISLSQPLQAKDKGKEIMATTDADKHLAEQLQAQEREQLSIEERSKLLAELIESRRKYFAAKRSEEIKNKPPTKAQQKSLMCTYMKNMKGFKQKDFKGKSFDDIKKMFDKVYKRVNTFMDMNTEIVEESLKKTQAEVTKGSSKRAREELEQENAKKQKLDEQVQAKVADDDTTELKRCLEIVAEDDDDVTIKARPLSSKSPAIVDYKITKKGRKATLKSLG
nr:hypothetical protein [Tanacetum cinerariifolium]